jgi:putative transposon-encoded protein
MVEVLLFHLSTIPLFPVGICRMVDWKFSIIGGVKMRKILLVLLIFAVSMLTTGLAAKDKVIGAEAEHIGDIKIEKGNLRIGEDADVMGNIFIEEGDLFIADEVDIVGSITIKKGNIFIKDNVDITKTVTIELGNISMEENNDIHADIVCKKGTVKMGSNNDILGDVYAKELKRGRNSDIHGRFHKIEKQ